MVKLLGWRSYDTRSPLQSDMLRPHHCAQGVDPLDPLLQVLVQDRSFIAAVQTSQLHAAAGSAVRILRVRPAGGRSAGALSPRRLRSC